jgi:hypothetical protein
MKIILDSQQTIPETPEQEAKKNRFLSMLMNKMGVLMMEHLLVQELPPSQCILKDGMPEYCIIDGNHCVQTAQWLFPGKSFKWCCDIVNVRFSFSNSL